MHAALRDAALLDEIMAMPDGLDTFVGETGTRLSGGQARRVALARAFLKDAPILLLDEPTEGLDPVTENLVLHAMAMLMRGKTTVLITHQPQALRFVDAVLTLPPVLERQPCHPLPHAGISGAVQRHRPVPR